MTEYFNRSTKTISTRFTHEEVEAVEATAEKLGWNRSALFRVAVRYAVEHPEAIYDWVSQDQKKTVSQ